MESIVFPGSAIFGDLLSEVGMKPWWEVYRGYFFALSVGIAVVMSNIITPGPTINCLPYVEDLNSTIVVEVTGETTSWVNSFCNNQLPWLAYVGFIEVFLTVLTFLASNWWLHPAIVVKHFRTFAKIQCILTDLNMTIEDLKSQAFRPDEIKKSDEVKNSKINDALCLLRRIKEGSAVFVKYYTRNACLLVLHSLVLVLTISFAVLLLLDHHSFECSVNEKTLHVMLRENPSVLFICTHGIANEVIPLLLILAICVGFQMFYVSRGMRVKDQKDFKLAWRKYSEIVVYAGFMENFWKHSPPSTSKKIWKFISFVCIQDAIRHFVRLPEPTNPDDMDMDTYYNLLRKFGRRPFIQKTVNCLQEEKFFTTTCRGHQLLLKGFQYFRNENQRALISDIPENLIPRIVEAQQYELLANLLSILRVSKCQEYGKIEGLLGLDFNQVHGNEKSILQYALILANEGSLRHCVPLHLLWNMSFVSLGERKCSFAKIEHTYTYGDLLSKLGVNFESEDWKWLQDERLSLRGYEWKNQILLKGFQYARLHNQHIVWPDIPKEFIPQLVRDRKYELLVDLLSILWVSEDKEFGEIEGLLNLSFNQVDCEGQAVLRYAFQSTNGTFPWLYAALHLLWNVKFEGQLYVHFQGKSATAESLLDNEVEQLESDGKRQRVMLLDLIKKSKSAHCDQISAERNILGPHVRSLDNFSRQIHGFSDQPLHAISDKVIRKLCDHFSCLQISEWTNTTKDIAFYFYQKGLCKIFVELLNSFVRPGDSDQAQLDCGITQFDLSEQPDSSPPMGSILFYALQKSEHREQYCFTAIRHILACCDDPRNAKVWDEEGHSFTVSEFLERQCMSNADKIKLKRMFVQVQQRAESEQISNQINENIVENEEQDQNDGSSARDMDIDIDEEVGTSPVDENRLLNEVKRRIGNQYKVVDEVVSYSKVEEREGRTLLQQYRKSVYSVKERLLK